MVIKKNQKLRLFVVRTDHDLMFVTLMNARKMFMGMFGLIVFMKM